MSLSILKSNQYLPISQSIRSFFVHDGKHYSPDISTTTMFNGKNCLYDEGFALINKIEITVPSGYSLSALRIKTEQDWFEEVQYTSKSRNHNGEHKFTWVLSKVVSRVEIIEADVLPKATQIEINGRLISNLQEIYDNLSESYDEVEREWNQAYQKTKDKIKEGMKLDVQLNEKKQEIEVLKISVREHIKDVDTYQTAIDQLQENEKQLRFNLQSIEDSINAEKNNLDIKVEENAKQEEQNRIINTDIRKLTKELDRLKVEKYRYSEDFDSFKRELTLQNTLFLSLITFFLIAGSAIVYSLIEGSHNLLRSYNTGSNIYELIVSRVPSVLIHSLIIFFFAKWVGLLVEGLISNLNDTKKLKQLVYLVTEVTESQAVGLPESRKPGDRYKQRVEQKMSIIKDALCLSNEQHIAKEDSNPLKKATEVAGDTIRVVSGR